MRVRFYATLRALVGTRSIDVPLAAGATVLDLARVLVERHPELADHMFDESGGLSRRVHFMVDGRNVRWLPDRADTVLTSEHSVDLFPPAAGG